MLATYAAEFATNTPELVISIIKLVTNSSLLLKMRQGEQFTCISTILLNIIQELSNFSGNVSDFIFKVRNIMLVLLLFSCL
ncbi:hypothetical protein Niako_4788 [Niastella koreensis GR20-10]|uniref:Uncharacterized protein n=1 Tax=Niastella koreensis (strain DSM 17620 / KACC 11465 / NBRC 106392 / GR20-10) TaxID=700598 RepID=G8TQ38_NIAKG|nr:hypothetical protein Niako_4788 [Niastella koreensis GR20-10]